MARRALLSLLLLTACQSAQAGPTTTRIPESVGGFDHVVVASALEVEIVKGDTSQIELSGSDEDLDAMVVETRGQSLYLSRERSRRPRRSGHIHVHIVTPTLTGIEVSGASDLRFSGFGEQGDFVVDVSGASSVVGAVDGKKLALELSGASNLNLSGRAQACSLDASGASDAHLRDLACRSWTIDLSGASDAEVHATHDLGPVDLSGASDLRYHGKPALDSVSISGAASLDPG